MLLFIYTNFKPLSGSSEYEIWCFKIFRKSILHILESGMFRQKKLHHPCFLAEKIFAHVLISILNIKIKNIWWESGGYTAHKNEVFNYGFLK